MADEPPETLSESEVYALLASRRRRLILRLLQDFDTPISAAELAALVASCERRSPTDRDRQIAHLSLHHDHLPRLAAAAVIEYDRERGAVRTGPNFGVLVGVITERAERYGSLAE